MTRGFRELSRTYVEEIPAEVLELEHEKTGARLLAFLNDDDNKVFTIAFTTPPPSSNGLPHILEHSVLNGSRKYPSKEPFVELLKGSLATFLNAMTYPDKTVYPVASRNEKDFFNLVDVYLDAVFFPRLKEDPHILMQEGWHYELLGEDQPLEIRGVVYNEMKGAYSSPEAVLFKAVQEELFPDTPYRFDSGGDPAVIPTLDQKTFVAFHDTYYHPSNSRILVYGDVNLEALLKKLDEEYLSRFERKEVHAALPLQPPFPEPKWAKARYSLPRGTSPEGKDYLTFAAVAAGADEPDVHMALSVLTAVLVESPAAPLKKALLDAGLGEDVMAFFTDDLQQPVFAVAVKNGRRERAEEFVRVLKEELQRLVKEGLPKKLLLSSLTQLEFRLREADMRGFPKGLAISLQALTPWVYGADPLGYLRYEKILPRLKEGVEKGYFEALIEERLLKNPHALYLVLEATEGLFDEEEEKLKKELAEKKAQLSEEEKSRIMAETQALLKRQTEPDAPEVLALLPLLQREDVAPRGEAIPTEEERRGRRRFLYHPVDGRGIGYVNLYVPLRHLEVEEIPWASLLFYLLGKVDTRRRSYADVADEIGLRFGQLTMGVETFHQAFSADHYETYGVVRWRALQDKIPSAWELLLEILKESLLENRERIQTLLLEQRSRMEMSLYWQGHEIAAQRALSLFSPSARMRDMADGVGYFLFLKEVLQRMKERPQEVLEKLQDLYGRIFAGEELIYSFTGGEKEKATFLKAFEGGEALMGGEAVGAAPRPFSPGPRSEGLLSGARVQYVAKAGKVQGKPTGIWRVVQTVVRLDYLWNRVRVKGGAYGALFQLSRAGEVALASYRDPHLEETLKTFDGLADYLRTFDTDEREMTKYVIGTIRGLDQPLTPSMKGERADAMVLTGLSQEVLDREREEILRARPEDIRETASLFASLPEEGYVCVLGGSERLQAEKERFQVLTPVTGD